MLKKLLTLITLLSIAGLLATACAPAPTPQTVVETVVVEKEVEKVVTLEVEKVVTKEAEKEVIKEVPVEVIVRETGPDSVLDLIFVQHALCAWESFWCTVEAGIRQAADDMNVNATILGPDKFDLEKVAQLIDQAVAAQPDGIALTVTDADLGDG